MPNGTVRTTLTLPSDLLEAMDKAVREGKARSRNAFVATALRRELSARRRAEIDAAFAEMGSDPDVHDEAIQLEREFARASWEALVLGEEEYQQGDCGGVERRPANSEAES